MGAELLLEREQEVPSILQRFAGKEIDRLKKSLVYQGVDVPHGEGQHVFLLPGYWESNREFFYLANFLRNIGYVPETSGIGTNFGQLWQHELIRQKVHDTVMEVGTVYIIGHSLGGFEGAEIAQVEEGVKKTIAIGAPFLGGIDPRRTTTLMESIYSSEDGVVQTFMSQFRGPHTRNVEVHSPNHFELLCHQETFEEIGFALAS